MSVNWADLTIVKCSREQEHATYDHHFPHWGQPRGFTDIKDYYEREYGLHNDNQPWHKAKFDTWALVPRSDPTTTDLLASCETYRRSAVVLSPGEAEPTERVTYGIASVFCQPQHRGKAYPRHLLSLLHYVLAPRDSLPPFPAAWGQPPAENYGDATFSVLYSDVGPTYYSRCTKGESLPGWVSIDKGKRVWEIGADATAGSTEGWKWLDIDGAQGMEDEASRRIKRDLPSIGDKSKIRVAVLPKNGWFKINPQRYFLGPPGAERRSDPKFGAILPSDKDEKPFFAWTLNQEDGSENWRLIVSHVSGDVPFEAVVAAAKHEGATAIEAWQDYPGWDHAGSRVDKDKYSIACIAQYLDENDSHVEWEFSEKYAWM